MLNIVTMAFAAADEAHDAAASGGFIQDTSFWTLVAFVIVIAVFARAGLHKMIFSNLDTRAQKIADEINEARKMREEAQELLAQYQRRQREAEDEAAAIIEQAKKDAKRLAAEAREKIAEQTQRRTKAVEEKIARAETQALAEVRTQAAEIATAAAIAIIRDRMDTSAQTSLIDKAIADLRTSDR